MSYPSLEVACTGKSRRLRASPVAEGGEGEFRNRAPEPGIPSLPHNMPVRRRKQRRGKPRSRVVIPAEGNPRSITNIRNLVNSKCIHNILRIVTEQGSAVLYIWPAKAPSSTSRSERSCFRGDRRHSPGHRLRPCGLASQKTKMSHKNTSNP